MSKNTRNRILLTAVAALLLVAVTVGGTMAWLTAKSNEVKNTFSPVSIAIDLKEHKLNEDGKTIMEKTEDKEVNANEGYLLIPGQELEKDPFVRVTEGNCYLFVEVVNNATNYIDFNLANGWVDVQGADPSVSSGYHNGKVYGWVGNIQNPGYTSTMEAVSDTDDPVYILAGDKITVKSTVTTAMMEQELVDALDLTFYAYALQADNLTPDIVDDLWSTYMTNATN